jgi:type II secretory pathway pseudopilin PulG
MLELWNRVSLGAFDVLLGWSLRLPADVTLVLVAVLSAALLTGVRVFTANQDLLRRAAADKRRLRQLAREAKARGDRDAVKRHRSVAGTVAVKQFSAEGPPLLASVVPIAMLATWCFHRLAYHPPRAGEAVEVVAYTPVSAVSTVGVMQVVPQDGVAADRWVQPIAEADYHGQKTGRAAWRITAPAGPTTRKPLRLTFRYKDQSVDRELRIGQSTYAEPFMSHGEELQTELKMRPVKLLGVVPGLNWPGGPEILPPWVVGYLLIVVPFVFVLKRAARIA